MFKKSEENQNGKKKKSILKKWWFWALIVVAIAAAKGGSGDESSTTSNAGSSTVVESTENATNVSTKEEVIVERTSYGNGTYKVGQDIAAGEYLYIGSGYIQDSSDSSGEFTSIIYNDNVSGNLYLTVNEGEYLTLKGSGKLYSVNDAPSIIPEDGLYEDGMYKVGQDIPAGEYKVTNVNMGYIEVSTDSRHDIMSIVSNDNLQGDTYITVTDGQYLKLSRACIQK